MRGIGRATCRKTQQTLAVAAGAAKDGSSHQLHVQTWGPRRYFTYVHK